MSLNSDENFKFSEDDFDESKGSNTEIIFPSKRQQPDFNCHTNDLKIIMDTSNEYTK